MDQRVGAQVRTLRPTEMGHVPAWMVPFPGQGPLFPAPLVTPTPSGIQGLKGWAQGPSRELPTPHSCACRQLTSHAQETPP